MMRKPPKKKTPGDRAYEIGRAITSAVPGAGGPLQVMFENIFTAPLEKRKQAWLEKLAEVINELQQIVEGLTPQKLAQNEAFITVALQASQIAVRNHRQEKLEALRNAVLNSVLPNPPEEDQQVIFLRLIDQLTSSHLRVLALLDNPKEWIETHQIGTAGLGLGSVSTLIARCLPEFTDKREIYDQIVRDLQTEGLIVQGQFLHVTMTGHGMLQSRTSDNGKAFLKFISKPK